MEIIRKICRASLTLSNLISQTNNTQKTDNETQVEQKEKTQAESKEVVFLSNTQKNQSCYTRGVL